MGGTRSAASRRPGAPHPGHTLALTALLSGILLLSGCGREFLVLHPAGPVAIQELRIMALAAAAMGVVIVAVLVVFGMALVRFRDHPGNHAPYTPEWEGSRRLEFILFAIPILIVAIIAVPTVRTTFRLDRVPPLKDPILINVTSLDWKWLFEYPTQHIATTNYIDVPVGRPLLFELTADSPMNTFWVPQLGGMEYAMPGRVLPLWLQVNNAGRYSGRSGNFSGRGFVHMTFTVDAVSALAFQNWLVRVRHTAPPLTMARYDSLLRFDTVGRETYSGYPAATFPSVTHGFTLEGGMYQESASP